jgi:hypothetical protein
MSPPSNLTSSDTSSPSRNAASQDDSRFDADDEGSEPGSGVLLASSVWEHGWFGELYTRDLEEELRRRMRRRYETPVREGRDFRESVERWAKRAEAVWKGADLPALAPAVYAKAKLEDDNDDDDDDEVNLPSFYQAVIHTTYCLLLEAVVKDQHGKTSVSPLSELLVRSLTCVRIRLAFFSHAP